MKRTTYSIGLFLALQFAAGAAHSEQLPAWLSVPSTSFSGQQLEIRGGNLAPDTALTIKIVAPDTSEATVFVTTDSTGNLVASYVPNATGLFNVTLYTLDGNKISTADFGASAP